MRSPPAPVAHPDHDVSRIAQAMARLDAVDGALVLAISGGLDSMVLLDAVAHGVIDPHRITVATFDHGTGAHSAAAVDLVRDTASAHGLRCVAGQAGSGSPRGEAAWRAARWGFLARTAADHAARVVTAHTRDDQVETVLFRTMRSAGARGLAGLCARSSIVRPLLDITRAEIAAHARSRGVAWLEDPTNRSLDHARNRLRHDLLPALRRVDPGFDDALVAVGERAAEWREEIREAVSRVCDIETDAAGRRLRASAGEWTTLPVDVLAIVWPELLARLGVAADWRGTRRLVAFTISGRIGTMIPLSGGWVVRRSATEFTVERQVGD